MQQAHIQTEQVTQVKNFLMGLQDAICESLGAYEDQTAFHEDSWQHEHGGGVAPVCCATAKCSKVFTLIFRM